MAQYLSSHLDLEEEYKAKTEYIKADIRNYQYVYMASCNLRLFAAAAFPVLFPSHFFFFFFSYTFVFSEVRRVLQGADIVFHTASFGMSGFEMVRDHLIYQINVVGTQNVIRACKESCVNCLVYTSTANVVFCGQPIFLGDETLPYAPLVSSTDWFCKYLLG